MSAKIALKPKALKSIERRHPWIFSGAIQSVKGNPADGDIVRLIGSGNSFAGRGYYNSQSQITVRILSWNNDEVIDRDFWYQRLEKAIRRRGNPTYGRLVHAESDYLPGLIVDRYGDFLVLQALTLGIDQRKNMLAECLADLVNPQGIYERSDVDVRRKEGLESHKGVLWGVEPPDYVTIEQDGIQIAVDIKNGQKTGFYFDQAVNRRLFGQVIANGDTPPDQLRLLDTFTYSGGFTLHAARLGITDITAVDSSAEALELVRQNMNLNDFALDAVNFVQADVFAYLRELRDRSETFDVIVLDPPRFAHSSRQLDRATRGYKDINLLAFQMLRPGGLLWTFSCSNAVSMDLFQKVVFGAAQDAERDAQITHYLHATADHPIALTFPEGEYLKGLVCRV